jgi:ketosteroid isomerase-like protein
MFPERSSTIVSHEAAAIQFARAQQDAAIAARDIERVTALWTDDVSVRRGLGQLFTGRAAYRRLVESEASSDTRVVYQREPSDIVVSSSWPLGFETGTWTGHLDSGVGPVVIAGRYSAQWVKRDGRWLIRAEVFVALMCMGVGCGWTAEP